MAITEWKNKTIITEFILLGFETSPQFQILLFLVFLSTYIITMAGNILLVVLVVADRHLHRPMYYFLGNLSCLEIFYSSTILLRMLASLITGDKRLSVSGCIVQFYFIASLVCTECYLLSVMSYDRYIAICKPLHYAVLMQDGLCCQLASLSWVSGFLAIAIIIALMLQITFCGPNEIDSFFCDFEPLLSLSCSDIALLKIVALICSFTFSMIPFVLTLISYTYIVITVLKIPSTSGRQKAFSTCSSHLIVVILYYGTLIIVYMIPTSPSLKDMNKIFSLFYTVLTPLINPLIYSFRNKEVKESLQRLLRKYLSIVGKQRATS
ncbi:olfactory receptor 5B21-like [Eublepharis macularius]|uniref:Olfactory receptor n=1 Tax=Eublepharis macularius TaxID=481883 RepID=A0AA97K750_EUBMA|nr:olfactory receptor 5B21-like [Eublepharis macularius]